MKFYRFEESRVNTGMVLERTFSLVRETPCGYWIKEDSCGGWTIENFHRLDKEGNMVPLLDWVSKTARKRMAYPDRAAALTSFIARKRQHVRYASMRLWNAKLAYQAGLDLMRALMLAGETVPLHPPGLLDLEE